MDLRPILDLPYPQRIEPLVALAREAIQAGRRDPGTVSALVEALLSVLRSGGGEGRERLALGEVLGQLGDPRLRLPADEDYWAAVEVPEDGTLFMGRYPVTNAEFRRWVDLGGYHDRAGWSAEGLAWRDGPGALGWPPRARELGPELLAANQPVVCVTWFEAEAYAAAHGARLPLIGERQWVARGPEKRPYPWGAPFGLGNANTSEEVLGRPCAVGLYRADRTPEGVYDLAGNVAEWLGDELEPLRLTHPGSWRQPSMAAWNKARNLAPPTLAVPDLGFRLCRR